MDDNLERTLQNLHDSGIDATVESKAGDGMQVRIGDEGGERARTRIDQTVTLGGHRWTVPHAVARWPHDMALKCFPSSRYALANSSESKTRTDR